MRKNHIKFKPAFDESDVFLAVVSALIVGMLLGGYATLFYGLEKANEYSKANGTTYVADELAKVNAKLGTNK